MLRWLKNHFVPHRGNNHHPHLLRGKAIGALLGVAVAAEVLFLLAAFVILPQSGFLALIAPSALVQSANAERREATAPPLATNALLEQAAKLKAQDMAAKSYFAHTSPEGITPWHWLDQVDYKYTSAGENLAVDFIDSSDVHEAWMNSMTHRANILNSAYTEIGVATATGTYQGRETIFVVQFFGKPKASAPQRVNVGSVSASTPTPRIVVITPSPAVLPASTVESSAISQIVASPRKTTATLFLVIGALIVLALSLTAVMRLRIPHPRIALLPMAFLVVLILLTLLNQHLALGGLHVL